MTGTRRATWIESECQSCFQSVFILPGNVYPSTKRVSSSVLSGGFLSRLKVVVEEVFPKKERAIPVEVDPVAAAEAAYAAKTQSRTGFRWPRFNIVQLLRRTFSPFRLLMFSVIAVIGLTGYWMVHERRLEAAQQTWLAASDNVESLLENRQMASLEDVLTDAVNAGEVLGKSDSEWRHIRNLLDETRAVNNIASNDLLNAFHSAYGKGDVLVDDAADKVIRATSSGIYIFESWLRADPETDSVFIVDLPATPGRNAVELRVALPAIAELLNAADGGHVLFAAAIDGVLAPEKETYEPWQLTLDPSSLVLITSPAHCEEIGLPVETDNEFAELLIRQKEFVASSKTWEHRADTVIKQVEAPEEQL